MNLLVIGNDVDDIALDIWKGNTNYYVMNKAYLWCEEFTKYIKKHPNVIVSSTKEQFADKDINTTLEFLLKYNFIPVLVADDKNSFENIMYTAFVDDIPNTILYIKNKENKDYNEFIRIGRDYLLGKGLIDKNDKTISTPRKRKRTTTKK